MQKIVPLTRMRDESGHDVPMSGTNRGGFELLTARGVLQMPGDGRRRVRIVGAVVPSLD